MKLVMCLPKCFVLCIRNIIGKKNFDIISPFKNLKLKVLLNVFNIVRIGYKYPLKIHIFMTHLCDLNTNMPIRKSLKTI